MRRSACLVLAALAAAVSQAAAPPANLVGNPDPKALSGVWTAQMMGGPPSGAARQGGAPGPGAAGAPGPAGGPPGGPPAGGPPPGAGPAGGGPAGGPPAGAADPGRGSPVLAGGRGGRVAPLIKPEYLAQFPQGTLAPQQGTLRNNDASMLCIPDAYFGSGGGYPNLIIQTPKQVTLINEENHRHRRIYLDREHPKTVKPSYAGHSVGHWDGDTLVVHTIGLRERDGVRNPPGYSITERFHKINDGKQMEYSVTYDSDAYATPGTSRSTWTFRPDLHVQEEVCEQFSDNFNDTYFSKGRK